VRQTGSAWNQAFAAVFEPHLGAGVTNSVRAVSKIESAGVVVGLKVESVVSGRNVVQYVFSQPTATGSYSDTALGLAFQGRYAVATDNGDGSGSLYLGDGSSLTLRGYTVRSTSAGNTQAHLAFVAGQDPVLTGNAAVEFSNQTLAWRNAQFGTIADTGSSADAANPDGDMWTNAQEYQLGTNPLSADTAGPLQIGSPSSNLNLTFFARRASGVGYQNLARYYTIQTNDDLTNPNAWSDIAGYSAVLGDDSTKSAAVPLTASARFYRLRVWLAAP
jgi:hypothetical protein